MKVRIIFLHAASSLPRPPRTQYMYTPTTLHVRPYELLPATRANKHICSTLVTTRIQSKTTESNSKEEGGKERRDVVIFHSCEGRGGRENVHIHSVEQGAVEEWRGKRAFKAIVPTSLHSRTRVARSCTASLDFFAILIDCRSIFF